MLQAIRSKAGSLVVKILFALLILSFGVWGIGDIFRTRSPKESPVAKVGDTEIPGELLVRRLRSQLDQMRGFLGNNVDLATAKQLGLANGVLDRLINASLLDQEGQRLRLATADSVVSALVLSDRTFQENGKFSRARYNAVLAENNLTEDRYVGLLRKDIARTQLTRAMAEGLAAPETVLDLLYRVRNERRVAETVLLPADQAKDAAAPTEAQLARYHDDHPELFRAPERRGITLLVMQASDLAANITVPEEKLKDEYQARLAEFEEPEKRDLEQILVPNEAKAREAGKELAAGKSFAEVAKKVANQDADSIKLGWTRRDDMTEMPKLADAAFALKEGETSQPVQGPLGWHIVKVSAIQPGHTKSFEEAKPDLRASVVKEMASEELYKFSNQVEDALAGGSTIEQVAEKFKLKARKFPSLDAGGRNAEGEKADLPAAPEVLRVAFATASGETTRLDEAKTGEYFVLRVDEVVPSAIKPLAETRDRVRELYLADERKAAVESRAKDLAGAVAPGKPLSAQAQSRHLAVSTTAQLRRTGAPPSDLPPTLVAKLFALKPGEATTLTTEKGAYVVALKEIIPADPAADKDGLARIGAALRSNLETGLAAAYNDALRSHFPVEINHKTLDSLF